MEKKKTRHSMELGLILVFLSTQIANVYRLYTGKPADIAPWIISLAMLCMVNTKTSFFLNKRQVFLVVYQICILLFAIRSQTTIMQDNIGLVYILFVVAFIFISATNNTIDGEHFVFLMWAITGILNILTAIFFIYNKTERFNGYYSVYGSLLAARPTLATMSYFHVLAMLVYHPKHKMLGCFKIALLIAALYNIVITMRRGMFITMIFIFILHIYLTAKVTWNIKVFFRGFAIVAIVYILYLKIPYIHMQAGKMMDSAINALNTLLGKNTSSEDMAAAGRVLNRTLTLNEMKSFGLSDWLFGKGYNAKWIDFPFLQCFYDMGIPGGLFYIATQLLPFGFLAKHKSNMQNHEKLLFYLFIISFVNNFYSGIPYGMAKFMYIVPLLANWKNTSGIAHKTTI